ncbi:MAG: SDR family oxidoreductase [Dermatophilaceae bacterium]
MTGRHDGSVAVVTGASRGIGFAIAQRLVAEGARVVITARKPDALADAVTRLGGPEHATAVAGFTSVEAHQEEALATAARVYGPVNLLVNNTGINPVYGPILDTPLDAARKIMDTNVLAAFAWTQKAVAAGLGRDRPGAVVNIASIAGIGATGVIGMYGVSKAALIHLTLEMGYQLAPAVRVNAVAPAVVKTKFAEALYAADEAKAAAPYPMRRLGIPDDIAGAVSFLLSGDAAWITGQTIIVDGGVTLNSGL